MSYIQYPIFSTVATYSSFSAFPASGATGDLALAIDTNVLYDYNSGWNAIGGSGSVLSIGTIDSQVASANGAVIASNALVMQSASASVPGLMNNTTQTISGAKTFSSILTTSSTLKCLNIANSYTATATAAGTTTLTSSSTGIQEFTGSTTQTVVLPVTSTLSTGFMFRIINSSSGIVTVQSSGANTIQAMDPSTTLTVVCILTSGTTAASWSAIYLPTGVASATLGGWLTSGTQSIVGVKTFTSNMFISGVLVGSNYIYCNNVAGNMITTATAGGTSTLSTSSAGIRYYTGTSNQNISLPVPSFTNAGTGFKIYNGSTGTLTILTNDGSTLFTMDASTSAEVICNTTSGTGTSSWLYTYVGRQPASSTTPGWLTTGTQTIAGYKSFLNIAYTDFTANSSTAITLSASNGYSQTITLTGSCTITMPSSPSSGSEQQLIVQLVQDGTGGRSVTWSGVTWATTGGVAPAINTTASASTYFFFRATSAGWIGFAANQNLGVTDASNAATGYIGEVLSSNIAIGSAISLTSNTAANITSLTLIGDWMVNGTIGFIPAGTTTVSSLIGSINTTSATQATMPAAGAGFTYNLTFTTGATQVFPTGTVRSNTSTNTVVYLVATAVFAVSTMTGYGYLQARRFR